MCNTYIIIRPINTNDKIIGNKTKNHDTIGAPASHIKFNTHVQNNTYNTWIINTNAVLGTSQLI